MKRFYKEAHIGALGAHYTVLLDGRALKTPAKHDFTVPTEALALEIATEWNNQEEKVDPASMPLMQLASTAIDRVQPQFDDVAQIIADYAGGELLCYRADETQLQLRQLQEEKWQPLLDWVTQTYQMTHSVTSGIMPIAQPEETLKIAQKFVTSLSAEQLTSFAQLVQNTGSFVLGLALFDQQITVEEAHALAELDEIWNEQLWGADAEAQARRDHKKQELNSAITFKNLL